MGIRHAWRSFGMRPACTLIQNWLSQHRRGRAALTQLHADALITLGQQLADAVRDLVTVAPVAALTGRESS